MQTGIVVCIKGKFPSGPSSPSHPPPQQLSQFNPPARTIPSSKRNLSPNTQSPSQNKKKTLCSLTHSHTERHHVFFLSILLLFFLHFRPLVQVQVLVFPNQPRRPRRLRRRQHQQRQRQTTTRHQEEGQVLLLLRLRRRPVRVGQPRPLPCLRRTAPTARKDRGFVRRAKGMIPTIKHARSCMVPPSLLERVGPVPITSRMLDDAELWSFVWSGYTISVHRSWILLSMVFSLLVSGRSSWYACRACRACGLRRVCLIGFGLHISTHEGRGPGGRFLLPPPPPTQPYPTHPQRRGRNQPTPVRLGSTDTNAD